MAEEIKTASRKPRRWLRWVGGFFVCMVVGLILIYFVGTSEWALKSVILPKVSKAANAEVMVDGASISPFSSVTLSGLKVVTKGADPLVTAKKVRLRYSLMDIIKGNINVSEVTLESPTVNLVTFADGTSNLDPITKAPKDEKSSEKKEPKDKKDGKPPQLNLQKIALNNATVRKVEQRKDGSQQVLVLSGVNITAADLANNKTGKLTIAADVNLDQGVKSASNGVLIAKLAGNFDIALDAALKPTMAKGQTKVDVTEGKGAFAQVNGLGVMLNTDVTPTQLNDVSIHFTQSGKNLGAITVNASIGLATLLESLSPHGRSTDGRLFVAISGIDRQLLNAFATAAGVQAIDFNQTTINSTNTIELTQRGRVVSVNGALLVGSFGVTQKGQTTPTMDIRSAYAVTMDQTNKVATVQSFTLSGTQGGNEFLRGTLAKPMTLNLGGSSSAVDESAFDLVLTNFNLPDWQAFIGTNATISSGKLAVTLNVISKQAGKNLGLNLTTRLSALTAVAGSNRIDNADIAFDMKGSVQDFSAVKLDSYAFQLARGGQKALSATGTLAYNTKSQDADVQADVDVSLPQVAALVVVPGLNVQSGTVKFGGRIAQKNTTPTQTNNPVFDRTIIGKLNLNELTGAFQSNRFDRFVTAVDLDLGMRGDVLDIRKASGTIQQSGQTGGSFDIAGNWNSAKSAGQITAKLVDLNQHALKSFVASALGEKQLETITINAMANANLSSVSDGSVKAELHVANLVVNDPTGAVPRTPLALDLTADAGMTKSVYDIKGIQLTLSKTERAANTLNVSGKLDMTKSNAWTGNVKINSEGLDLTTYYDLFSKKNTNAVQTAKSETPAPAPQPKETKPETEPPAMHLPFAQFVAELNLAKVFLREVAISNLTSKTTIENNRVNANPFSLTLNGSPVTVNALVNVGVPGYQYDVSAKLDGVPIEPLANTFVPEQRGIYKGEILSSIAIKGAGVTGRGLKENLGGQIGFTLTNAEIHYTDARFENKYLGWLVKWGPPVAKYLQVPELTQSPISLVDAHIQITNGTATLQRTFIESPAFQANVPGTITLNEVITNSTLNKLPLQLSLRRSIAEKARLAAKGSDTNAYVTFPSFVSIEGTIGKPKYDYNERAVLQLIARAASEFIKGDAGNILRGLGNLGQGTSTNQAGGTNATSANTNSIGNLLQSLPGLFDKQPKTNAPANPRRRQR
ncbi:MAG TPA: AsmA family protein [Candidatus Acidoferrum sp.]|nr:AsmA family protein [Candidatus Acidoferrum sp.]